MDNISWYVDGAVSIIKAVNEPIAVTAKVSETTTSVDQSRSVGASPATGRDVGALYEEYRDLLLFIASRKFRIGDGDAENLIQEVFLAYLQNEAQVENTRSWLVAATCNASRAYWRTQARTESLPDDIDDQSDPPRQRDAVTSAAEDLDGKTSMPVCSPFRQMLI